MCQWKTIRSGEMVFLLVSFCVALISVKPEDNDKLIHLLKERNVIVK
jgi:hypothetical protein